ncbi:hypothetical protein N7523_001138 [Penicillium sp. IBT 18751x]|nr:hypothetical protein N7523_001138 [Penicillium sp. IBT 18751x]
MGRMLCQDIEKGVYLRALRAPPPDLGDEDDWKKQLLVTITSLRLPFQIIENQHFRDLLRLTQQAPSLPNLQTGKTVTRQLQSTVQVQQEGILKMLPSDAKLSLALDCWTLPFHQAFMAITGYFLDEYWEYKQILLGFEPLDGSHTGENLALALCNVIDRHRIKDKILAITTDNALNNKTMFDKVQRTYPDISIVHIPCMAHVIQLSLNELLHRIKAKPQNDTVDIVWTERLQKASTQRGQKGDIANTLDRIRWKQQMLIALEAGLQKLREYYAKTDQPEAGNVYAHSTILAPKDKLQYFKRKEWSGGPEDSELGQTWAEHYNHTLQDRIKTYQSADDHTLISEAFTQVSELDRMLDNEGEANLHQDELTRYLQAEDQQLELARTLEVPEEGENEKISPMIEGIDPISDTEEGEEEARLSVRAGKRRKSVLSDYESEQSDEDDGASPSMSQIRLSERARKAPKIHEGFEISK